MDFPVVYVIVDVDSEYGHRSVVAVYLSLEGARAALAHLYKARLSPKWAEVARDVFGVAGPLTFESLEVDAMPVITCPSLALA